MSPMTPYAPLAVKLPCPEQGDSVDADGESEARASSAREPCEGPAVMGAREEGVRLVEGLRLSAVARFPSADAPAGTPVDVREVRRWLLKRLVGTGVDADDLDVIAAEIGTNAVTHTASGTPGGCLWVAVSIAREQVRLEFTDDGGADGEPDIPACSDEGGRGLLLVSALTDAWGWHAHDDGRVTVWAELHRTRR